MFASQISSLSLLILLQFSVPNLASNLSHLFTYQEVLGGLYPNSGEQPETWKEEEYPDKQPTPKNLWLQLDNQNTFPSNFWRQYQGKKVKPNVFKRPNAFNWAKKSSPMPLSQTIPGFNLHGVKFPENYPYEG